MSSLVPPRSGAGVAVILLFLGCRAASAAPCAINGQRYNLVGDEVTWSMRVESGHRCTRGVRYYNVELGQLKLISPPSSGEVSVSGWGFTYIPKEDFRGQDQFVVGVSGNIKKQVGSSTIRIVVSVVQSDARPAAGRQEPPR
jgi:hypothetical protein